MPALALFASIIAAQAASVAPPAVSQPPRFVSSERGPPPKERPPIGVEPPPPPVMRPSPIFRTLAPPPPAAGPPAIRAIAMRPFADYFSPDDYPAAALAAGQQGEVRFVLRIGANGRVDNCTITRSSGSSWLDSTACRILRARARYRPARDSAGTPVPDTDRGAFVWRLPVR